MTARTPLILVILGLLLILSGIDNLISKPDTIPPLDLGDDIIEVASDTRSVVPTIVAGIVLFSLGITLCSLTDKDKISSHEGD